MKNDNASECEITEKEKAGLGKAQLWIFYIFLCFVKCIFLNITLNSCFTIMLTSFFFLKKGLRSIFEKKNMEFNSIISICLS